MADILIEGVNKTFRPLAYIVVAFGALVAVLGVVLVYLGNTGTTTIALLGQKVNTSSVGIAAIALGCIVVGVSLMKIIGAVNKSMDRILKRKDLFEEVPSKHGSDQPPKTMSQ